MAIGTQNESALHRALKAEYAGLGGKIEAPLGEFVCDAVSKDGVVIEVQTGSLKPLEKKITQLCAVREVRVIHPIIVRKFIEVYDGEGVFLYRRKSPRRGTEWDVFGALVYAAELALLPNFSLHLAMVEIIEKRIKDGKGSWRRKGISIADKILSAHEGTIVISGKNDYRRLLPFKKKDEWTARSLSEKVGINASLARKAVYVLTKIGVIARSGKKGNTFLYKIA